MNVPVVPFINPTLPTGVTGDGALAPERAQEVAREFEAMLVHQLLKQMREASSWFGNEEDDRLFGNQLLEAVDVELARQLATGGGLGLAAVLMPQLADADANTAAALMETARAAPTYTAPGLSVPGVPELGADASLASRHVTSEFGLRQDPIDGGHRFHGGVDLRAAYGREIGAAESGTVVFAGEQGGYGLTVVLEHGAGVQTRYAHLSAIQVSAGDRVGARDPIGRAGDTGRATGSHLHFELIRDGERVDPASIEGGIENLLKKLRLSADWSNSRT